MIRLGLIGGTFNPIHRCHLTIATHARDRLELDRILFIPAGDPPHKPPYALAPAAHRYEMVTLAVTGDPTFVASDLEVRRQGKSYTIDTVRMLSEQADPPAALFFILGIDSFLDVPTWKQSSALLELCHFVVVSRPGTPFATLAGSPLDPPLDRTALARLDSGEEDLIRTSLKGQTELVLLRVPPCHVSASEIHRRLSTGESLAALLPAPVESYIIRHKLYREDTDRTRL